MPRDIKLLTIFVSCPQDLPPERSVLESVIDELNQKLRDSHSVEFRTMGWGSLVPGVGPDAQAVINNQVGEDYDIYIGILGHRFGTQTPRAGSGTEEEFERAYQRWRNVPDTVRILFYFKSASDAPLQELDLAQLGKVQEFRRRISPQVLYSNFKTADDFLKQVRDHLWQLIIREWKAGKWTVPTSAPVKIEAQLPSSLSDGDSTGQKRPGETISESEGEEEEDAAGMLDAVVEAQESMDAGLAALSRITIINAENNSKLEEHAKEIAAINSSGVNARHLRTAVNAAADDMAHYARSLRAEVPVFIAGFSLAFSSLETALAAWIGRGSPQAHRSRGNSRRFGQWYCGDSVFSRFGCPLSRNNCGDPQTYVPTEKGLAFNENTA